MFAIDHPYTFVLIASVIISISMAVAVLMHKHTLGVHAFAALKAAVGMWAFTSLFEVCSQDISTKIFSYSLKYLFIVVVPVTWFIFGLYYSNRLRRLKMNQLALLFAIPVLTVIAVATNRYHHWMFTSLEFVDTSAYVFIIRKFGPWFWVHATYSYILLFLGFFFMAKHLIDSPSPYRWQVITLLIGGLAPWVANIAFTLHLTPFPYLDLTPFAFTISGVAFMWGILRFQLLDVAPIAHEVVIQNIGDAIFVVDSWHRILNLNSAAQNLIDLNQGNPIGTEASKVLSWWSASIGHYTGPGDAEPLVIDLMVNHRRRLMRLKKVPIFCNHRETGLLITLTDVTDALLAKEALLNSERRFRSLSENAPIIIFALDTHGTITYINPAWGKILGHTRQDLLGKPFIELISHNDEEACQKIFLQLLGGQVPVAEINLSIGHKTHSPRLFNTSLAANSDTEGRVTGIIGMAKDITEERKLQHQLFQSQKMQAVGTLAGGVAHDFNNLLMGIQANLSLMRQGKSPDDAFKDKIRRIEDQVQSGASLTRHLLGYARKGQYRVSIVDMKHLIEETLNVVQRANKNITIQQLFPDSGVFVKADQGQMEMVLLNLFLNAVDAMPEGGRLTVSCRQTQNADGQTNSLGDRNDHRYIEVMVADTGIGMDPATQERIFEPFFTTKEVGRGTGLGLASVYGVVHNHGGSIQVESALGQGTTFTLLFPAAGAPPDAKPVAPADEAISSVGGTILLVEDEPLIRKYCQEMVRALDFEVFTAEAGQEAIRIYEERNPVIDLVILDMIMPGMDGGAVFERLKEINPHVKVIITSGYSVDRRMNQILDGGRNGYLKKPYTMDELAREIARIMAGKPYQNEYLNSDLN